MQRLEVSGAVRLICKSLGVKGLSIQSRHIRHSAFINFVKFEEESWTLNTKAESSAKTSVTVYQSALRHISPNRTNSFVCNSAICHSVDW